ncbi:MAG: hypothetical protein NVS9B7_11190 [Flavisolibacter sp.]
MHGVTEGYFILIYSEMQTISKYNAGIFLISASTLLFELSLTRVFSVTLWYHFGFLIISTALLGFGVAGVLLSLWKNFRENYSLDKALGWLSICLSAAIVFCFWLLQKIPFDPFSLYDDKMQLLYMPLTYIMVSMPFFFAGLALSLVFTRLSAHINQIYAFDLAGAGFGCLAIIFTISYFGGGGSVLFAATFSAVGAILFFGRKHKVLSTASLVLFILGFIISLNADRLIPLRITTNKRLSSSKQNPVFSKWNTFSKIDLYIDSSSVIQGKKSPALIIDQGTAATGLDFDLKPGVKMTLGAYPGDSLYTSCVAYLGRKMPSILIIGSGCGTQVLDGLHHRVKKVTAVDINPIINNVVRNNEYWADLFHQPEVELVTDEGRNFVRSTKEKYDAIISEHTISNAAIASGALSLSENYVLTKEAFEDYFDHLTDSGIIYFTRPEYQLPRIFSTGREVLEEKNIKNPALHLFAYTYPLPARPIFAGRKSFYAVFLMSKSPLSRSQTDSIKLFIAQSKKQLPVILYDPYTFNKNIYDSIATFADLGSLYKSNTFQIAPATDNTPFFNHHTRWASLNWKAFKDIFSQKKMGRLALEDKPIAEVSLIILLLQVIFITFLFILLPLWKFSSISTIKKNIYPYMIYFSGLGCGFIMVEIVMIQLFSLLLGEPVYTFAIVLAALLVFSGLGAYISGKYAIFALKTLKASIIALSLLLLIESFFLPSFLRLAIGLGMNGRIALAILLILPLGILLGMPFPSGIQLLRKQAPEMIPWAWGLNGFCTVIGSILAIILSMMVGFQAVLWISIIIYLISMMAISSSFRTVK